MFFSGTTRFLGIRRFVIVISSALATLTALPSVAVAAGPFSFGLVRSPILSASCAQDASGTVRVREAGPVQIMTVSVKG